MMTTWRGVMGLVGMMGMSACQSAPAQGDALVEAQRPALAFFGAVASAEEMEQISASICGESSARDGRWHCAACPDEQAPYGEGPTHEVTIMRQGRWALAWVQGCKHADMVVYESSGVFVMRQEGERWERERYEAELSITSCERRAYGEAPALWCGGRLEGGQLYVMHVITADDDALTLRQAPTLYCDAPLECAYEPQGQCALEGRWSAPDLSGDGQPDWSWEGEVVSWSGGEEALEGAECAPVAPPAFEVRRERVTRRWVSRDGEDEELVAPAY